MLYCFFLKSGLNPVLNHEFQLHNSCFNFRKKVPFCPITIDVPFEFRSSFKGTVGHKINHSFAPNSAYTFIDSAR
jgi:hypothetical protein